MASDKRDSAHSQDVDSLSTSPLPIPSSQTLVPSSGTSGTPTGSIATTTLDQRAISIPHRGVLRVSNLPVIEEEDTTLPKDQSRQTTSLFPPDSSTDFSIPDCDTHSESSQNSSDSQKTIRPSYQQQPDSTDAHSHSHQPDTQLQSPVEESEVTTELLVQRIEQIEDFGKRLDWCKKVFISHNSKSINDSYFIWHQDQIYAAKSYKELALGTMNETPGVTCEGNPKNKTISELLKAFCQEIELPFRLPVALYTYSGILATCLFKQYSGKSFKRENLPFGIKGVVTVDPIKQYALLKAKTGGRPVEMQNYHDVILLHADKGMLDRGLINVSVFGNGANNEFAFMIIVDITNEEWVTIFREFPSHEFFIVVAAGCFIFNRAQAHIKDPSVQSEAAVLAREIGQAVFEESTSELGGNGDANEDEVEEGTPASSSTAPKPKKKKKSKKSKKGRGGKKIAVDEGSTTQESAVVTSTEVSPPSPGPSMEATQSAVVPLASSSMDPLPTMTIIPPTSVAFSFLSRDPRLVCALAGCSILANASFPSAVICPRCTEYSFVRYCSRPHLFADVRAHFGSGVCGSRLVPGAIDDTDTNSAFPPRCMPIRPYVQELAGGITVGFTKNIIERHRQALYRAMSDSVNVDYYVFDDIERTGLPKELLRQAEVNTQKRFMQDARGKGQICATVVLPAGDENKIRFNQHIDTCLRLGLAAATFQYDNCMWIFYMIRDNLRAQGVWDMDMEEKVAMQFGFEFGWRLPESERGM